MKSSASFATVLHNHCKRGHGLLEGGMASENHLTAMFSGWDPSCCGWGTRICGRGQAQRSQGRVMGPRPGSGHGWGGRAGILARWPLWAALPHRSHCSWPTLPENIAKHIHSLLLPLSLLPPTFQGRSLAQVHLSSQDLPGWEMATENRNTSWKDRRWQRTACEGKWSVRIGNVKIVCKAAAVDASQVTSQKASRRVVDPVTLEVNFAPWRAAFVLVLARMVWSCILTAEALPAPRHGGGHPGTFLRASGHRRCWKFLETRIVHSLIVWQSCWDQRGQSRIPSRSPVLLATSKTAGPAKEMSVRIKYASLF